MKQLITLTRTETLVVEVDFRVDPQTKANIEDWANHPAPTLSALVHTELKRTVTDWVAKHSRPNFTPAGKSR